MTLLSQPSSTACTSGRPLPAACFVCQSVRALSPVSMLVALILMFGVLFLVLRVELVESHGAERGDGQCDRVSSCCRCPRRWMSIRLRGGRRMLRRRRPQRPWCVVKASRSLPCACVWCGQWCALRALSSTMRESALTTLRSTNARHRNRCRVVKYLVSRSHDRASIPRKALTRPPTSMRVDGRSGLVADRVQSVAGPRALARSGCGVRTRLDQRAELVGRPVGEDAGVVLLGVVVVGCRAENACGGQRSRPPRPARRPRPCRPQPPAAPTSRAAAAS